MMRVMIYGVGRSGTTMLYSLLQRLFHDQYGENFESVYEPFLWERQVFDRPYAETKQAFAYINSLSAEGIYHHSRIPLFLSAKTMKPYLDNDYCRRIANPQNGHDHLVAKLIRANGRMPLFRALFPEYKFVLILRNPLDVVNSLKNKFSFFGDDFHRSDYRRFCKELDLMDKLLIEPGEANWVQRQAEYWYQMNAAAAAFAAGDDNTHVIVYEQFIADKERSAQELAQFLSLSAGLDAIASLDSASGQTTPSVSLSETEQRSILPYHYLYQDLCQAAGKDFTESDRILDRYRSQCIEPDFDTGYDGMTALALKQTIRQQQTEIDQYRAELNPPAKTGT